MPPDFRICDDKPGMFQHACPRYGDLTYVSEISCDDADLLIPGCGCRPGGSETAGV